MKKYLLLGLAGLLFAFVGWCILLILPASDPESEYENDFARVEKARVYKKQSVQRVEEILQLIKQAKQEDLKVSIAGTKYSGGGHTFSDNGLIVDMSHFKKVIGYNKQGKTITVESGITWGEIQDYVNADDLAVGVMQSSNIFSVGGSVATNIHGRDPRLGTIIESVESFRLITADGELLNVSREENPELFSANIGGYGLFGIITDVTLRLSDNETYIRSTQQVDYDSYIQYLRENIIGNKQIGLHFGRLSISPGDTFLKDFHVTNFTVTDEVVDKTLQPEKWVLRNRFFFNLSRKYDGAKTLRWELQKRVTDNVNKTKVVSRNNAMRPPIEFISYYSEKNTDILQEYFIPLDNYNAFIDKLRAILQDNDVNLLNITTRYISKGDIALLRYNKSDMIAIVLYMNVGLSQEEQNKVMTYTREIIDVAGELGGTHYLVYQNHASDDQIKTIYPEFKKFLELKDKYDPNGLFSNKFYERYKDIYLTK